MHQFIDPTQYFDVGENGGKKFKAWTFAVDLEAKYRELNRPFVTTEENDHIYGHNGLTYYPNGGQQVEKEVRGTFGDSVSERDVNEVKRSLRVLTRKSYAEAFNLRPEKVVVQNGMVDLIDGSFTPADELDPPATLTLVPVEYDESADAPQTDEFIRDLVPPETVPEVYELIGYSLYRAYDYQKAIMFLGAGSNGKSTLLNLIERFLGPDNVTNITLHDFARDRFKTAKLEGKLANLGGDLDSSKLYNTGMLKKLTGGDTIDAQRKYEDSFEFENYATMIFAANELPETEDKTDAFYRRWKLIDFPNQFLDTDEETEDQSTLLARLESEFPGLLNRAIEGFQRLYDRGGFKMPGDLAEMQEEYERRSNSVKAWVEDNVQKADDRTYIRKKEAHTVYRDWCEENSLSAKSYKSFKDDFEENTDATDGKDPDDGRRTVWIGVTIEGEDGDGGATGDATNPNSQLADHATDGGELSQADRKELVRDAIERLGADGGVSRADVVNELAGDVPGAKVNHDIDALLDNGTIYEPEEDGKYRLT